MSAVGKNDTKLCMQGRIYAEQKCKVCNRRLEDNHKDSLCCPHHPGQIATRMFVRFGRKICKRFKSYEEASRFLIGLRYKKDEGTFDARDYMNDNPLGFQNQAEKWLEIKKKKVKPNSYRNIKRDINKAISVWQQRNVKTLKYAEIEDFLYSLDVGGKTRANTRSVLHDFWTWLSNREEIPMPKFPECDYELGWRNIIDIGLQQKIIKEIKRISYDINPKIWIGVKWLSTYVAFRPNELRNLKEKHINVNGFFVVPSPKEKKPKLIAMLPDDIALYLSLTRGMPEMYFFRHVKGNGSAKPESQFGKDYLYKWWKKACLNLGVENVDLYGGTRHSTTTALSEHFTKEELRESGTMHATNEAFERYMQSQKNDSLKVYEKVREIKEGKVVEIKKSGTG